MIDGARGWADASQTHSVARTQVHDRVSVVCPGTMFPSHPESSETFRGAPRTPPPRRPGCPRPARPQAGPHLPAAWPPGGGRLLGAAPAGSSFLLLIVV